MGTLLLLCAVSQPVGQGLGYAPRPDLEEHVRRVNAEASWRFSGPVGAVPKKYDCRVLGLVGPVESQGDCGSCWLFAGVDAVQSALFQAGQLANDGRVTLSRQYVMDCGRNGGCRGDDPSRVIAMARGKGLPTTSEYGPYKARAGACAGGSGDVFYRIIDSGYCGDDGGVASTSAIKESMLRYGPISTCCSADGMGDARGDRVFKHQSNRVNHCVVLCGWDDSVGTSGAWLMRNSWGRDWGQGGYLWIEYGANKIGSGALWVVAEDVRPSRVGGRFHWWLVVLVVFLVGAVVVGGFGWAAWRRWGGCGSRG